MEQTQTLVDLLQQQYDTMERFANAQARLLNVSSSHAASTVVESENMEDALSSLYDVKNQLRSNLKKLEQDAAFCRLHPRHLALSRRVAQTIASNPSWHTNGLPSHTKGITETNTVALASLRASIERIFLAERERVAA